MTKQWRRAVFLVAWAAAAGLQAQEPTVDGRFLGGLRARHLYALAEQYCTAEQQRGQPPPARQAELAVELSRTLAAWAAESAVEKRPGLWRRSALVIEQFATRQPTYPDLVAVRLQGVLSSLLARGELARQEAQFRADNSVLLEDARGWLRQAIRALRDLAEQLDKQLRQSRPDARDPTSRLTEARGLVVRQKLQFHLARALRNQGECYPTGSPDFTSAVSEAMQLLEPLAALDSGDPLVWRSRIEFVRGKRLLGHTDAALRLLEAFRRKEPPASIALELRAEELRLIRVAGPPLRGDEILRQGREIDGRVSAELDLARLESYLAAWRAAVQAENPAAASQHQAHTRETLALLERHHAPYWGCAGRRLLTECLCQTPEITDCDLLVMAAQAAYRAGQLDLAIAVYDRARTAAAKRADRRMEFDLAYLAAAIEHQRVHHLEALRRFCEAARAMPKDPRAHEAFALGVYHAAQLARSESPAAIQHYESLLREHLSRWPRAATGSRIRGQLARLLELRNDWPGAIAVWRAIPGDDPLFTTAVDAVLRCYDRWIAQERRLGEATETIAVEAAAWLKQVRSPPAIRAERPSP